MQATEPRVMYKLSISAILLACCIPSVYSALAAESPENWATFANKSGWSVRYPRNWDLSSCNNCPDLTDPDVFVNFSDPSTNGMVTIQHLKNKPVDQSADDWLNHVKKTAIANPLVNEQWSFLDGARALRVTSRNPDSTESENVYVVDGQKVFFIQASPIGKVSFYLLFQQMLSTFRFSGH